MPADETIRVPSRGVPSASVGGGDLTDELIAADVWSDRQVAAAGMPVVDVPFVTIGGGIGSFVTFDYLRIAGVPKEAIKVLGNNEKPWSTYEYLTRNSQIPRQERLRSDSASTPDCIWGFPSYAVREALAAKGLKAKVQPVVERLDRADLLRLLHAACRPGLRVDGDAKPHGSGTSTASRTVSSEWSGKRDEGGYFTVLTPPEGTSPTRRVVYRSRWVHIAVGYPGLKFLDDLQAYRRHLSGLLERRERL